jgi:PIN domain nuclease of toxin-antitoxin system
VGNSRVVLDSSAVLAAFFREPGADVVRERGSEGLLSTVSSSEILAKLCDRNVPLDAGERFLSSLNLTEVPFDHEQAVVAASLRRESKALGLSFADRACLACAHCSKVPVLTADRSWTSVKVDVEVVLIR